MQAHPLSSPAARITSTSCSTLSNPPRPSSAPASATSRVPTRILRSDSPPTSVADSVGLAHDAGNLLAALGLYCDLLSVPGVLRPEHQHYATELSLISNRSSTLIRRLVAPPCTTTPATTPQVHPSSRSAPRAALGALGEPLSDAANHASVLRKLAPVLQRIASGTAQVTVICPATLPPQDFTSDILERIIVNLVTNAAAAIRTQRSSADSPAHIYRCGIRVSLNLTSPNLADSNLHLAVEDDGPGMPPELVAEFLHPSPLPQGATHGLGHRIVHDLAIATGAQLDIRALPGKGTIVSILWPTPAPLLHGSTSPKVSSADASSVPSTQSPAVTSQGSATC